MFKVKTPLSAREDVEKLAHIVGENIKWYSHSAKTLCNFFKNQTYDYKTTQQLRTQAFIPEK